MKKNKSVLIDKNPGRNAQTFGIARELGTNLDISIIHLLVLLEMVETHNVI